MKDNTPYPEFLKSIGVIPGIKVDKGAHLLPGSDIERITAGLDGLDSRLKEYYELDDNKKYARDSEFSGHVNRQGYADSKRNDGHVIPYRFRLFGDESFKLQIPQNEYLAFGDNTMNSTDSRDWGTLPGKNIFGTPSFIYWPFFSQPGRNRPHRFGWAFQ